MSASISQGCAASAPMERGNERDSVSILHNGLQLPSQLPVCVIDEHQDAWPPADMSTSLLPPPRMVRFCCGDCANTLVAQIMRDEVTGLRSCKRKAATCCCRRAHGLMVPQSICMADDEKRAVRGNGQKGAYTLLFFMNSSGRSVSSLSLALMITSPSVACNSMRKRAGLHCHRPDILARSYSASNRAIEQKMQYRKGGGTHLAILWLYLQTMLLGVAKQHF